MNFRSVETYFSKSKVILVPCFHLAIIYSVYELLVLGSFITRMDLFHFKQWDAYWYASIAEQGYQFSETKASNCAFFPLFPYVWKILWKIMNAGVDGVCLFNTLTFLAGMLILKKAFGFSWSYFLVFVSIPSNIFMYVPYSEATFFFFSSLILAGLKTNKKSMVFTGLFLASLTRPSATFFIPAILAMEIMSFVSIKSFIKNILTYSSIPVLAILIVFIFQYYATGVWLAFFKDGWTREMKLPEFPLTTWGGFKNLWLDALALFFGLLAIVTLLVFAFKKLKEPKIIELEKAETFSLAYVTMALLTILLFGGKDADGGTTLLSLNRFLMATPYFTLMLYFLSHHIKLDLKAYSIYAAVAVLTLFLLNLQGTGYTEYTRLDKSMYTLLMFALILLFSTISLCYQGRFLALVYVMNVFLQVLILNHFSNAQWIG